MDTPEMPDKSIVVLPFVNMSQKEDMEFFSDGITEEIINALAKIQQLKVTSRTSSFYFKNKNLSIQQIANELKVAAVLEGSVRVAGETVRITAQLIHADEDYHIWSETWDRKLVNIFELQDEISLLIAGKLREYFGHFEIQEHLVEKKTETYEAYEFALRGKYHFNKWNPEDVTTSIEFFEKALALDPRLLDAYTGLADAYGFMAATELMDPLETWQKVKQYVQKAYALNPDNAAVHYQWANLAFFQEVQFQEALQHIRHAVTLNPNYPEAQQFLAFLYILSENFPLAEQHLQLAHAIDPLSQETLFYRAYFAYRTQKYPEALTLLDACLANNAKNIPAIVVRSYCLLMQEQYNEVLDYVEILTEDLHLPDEKLGLTCLTYLLKKEEPLASDYFNQLKEAAQKPTAFQAHSYLYLAHALRNESDQAFAWVEKLMSQQSPVIQLSFTDPLAQSLKNEAPYASIKQVLYPDANSPEEVSKKKGPLLDKKTAENYTRVLLDFMDEAEPFLMPKASLTSLADQVNMHPNKLSWLLNESIGKNFNDFINHYRIAYFKKLVLNPDNNNISLIGLAYESGFNSKTLFNTYFKKEEGMTPKEFLKQNVSDD